MLLKLPLILQSIRYIALIYGEIDKMLISAQTETKIKENVYTTTDISFTQKCGCLIISFFQYKTISQTGLICLM